MNGPNFKLDFMPNFSHGFDLLFGHIFDPDDGDSGIPNKDQLVGLWDDGVGSIALLISDYANIGPDLQAVLFADSTTPIVFEDYAAFFTVISGVPSFNTENAMGTSDETAIYEYGTDRNILDEALRYFGLYVTNISWSDLQYFSDGAYFTS